MERVQNVEEFKCRPGIETKYWRVLIMVARTNVYTVTEPGLCLPHVTLAAEPGWHYMYFRKADKQRYGRGFQY